MVRRALSRLVSSSGPSSAASTAGSAGGAHATTGATSRAESGSATTGPADPLSVCLLSYRGDPHSGGQGVYVKHLGRALVDLGHDVTVVAGQPYPDVDSDVRLVELPGEGIVDEEDRLGAFEPAYLHQPAKLFEWLSVLTGGFPEPYTFGRRAVAYLADHGDEFDVVHDNQSLCYGLVDLLEMDLPTVATVHHPITVDRDLDLAHAEGLAERLLTRRWYRFLSMQASVVRQLPHLISVSEAAKRRTVADFGADPEAVEVVYNGVDTELFAPREDVDRQPSRVMTTVSADVPLKGVRYLLEGFAAVRERHPDAELVVVGEFREGGTAARLVDDLGIGDAVETHGGISYARMVDLYASAAVAVVPSLFEGFGLPAGEAMACGVPVVATRGGALPEVVGDAGVLVPPGDADALARATADLLADPERRRRLGDRARERVRSEFDWEATARETVATYRRAIDGAG